MTLDNIVTVLHSNSVDDSFVDEINRFQLWRWFALVKFIQYASCNSTVGIFALFFLRRLHFSTDDDWSERFLRRLVGLVFGSSSSFILSAMFYLFETRLRCAVRKAFRLPRVLCQCMWNSHCFLVEAVKSAVRLSQIAFWQLLVGCLSLFVATHDMADWKITVKGDFCRSDNKLHDTSFDFASSLSGLASSS